MERNHTVWDKAAVIDQLDGLLEGGWIRGGNTFELLSVVGMRILIVVDHAVTVHHRGVRDEFFTSATFAGPDAAERAAAHAGATARRAARR
ncbi:MULTISPECIES: hypothetical protein [unclassified Microbacterium]|uniref:hypothetical protein n=1 Tax=unclassified Microbacterium TaxID=2609290 RepID=UPI000EA8ECD0|nr:MULTISPECIES: hypothetical protein [unclassified Microbacterium]MBT2484395.1 hypothetical protein [Microbacterium sp. ISL-108]RKN67306.1 hypothetical protein D7252_06765 [Microbacterium sp. CGR2]